MGYGNYDLNSRSTRATTQGYHTKSVNDIFEQNKVKRIHESMDPNGVKFRECCDSVDHPNSVPIILTLDVTGSMGRIPHNLIKDGLPTLMGKLTENGVKDASLLFTAIGDHKCDQVPLQVGQFESDDEKLDSWLTKTYLEGNGGGNGGESYFLSWYFASQHTKIDSFDKRGRKGYLFTIGDEKCHNTLPKSFIKENMGDTPESDYTVYQLLADAQRTYNVYHLHIMEGSMGYNTLSYWKELLGDNCIEVKDHASIPRIMSDIIIKEESKNINNIVNTVTTVNDILTPSATVEDVNITPML